MTLYYWPEEHQEKMDSCKFTLVKTEKEDVFALFFKETLEQKLLPLMLPFLWNLIKEINFLSVLHRPLETISFLCT